MEASFVMGSGLRRKMLLRDRQKKLITSLNQQKHHIEWWSFLMLLTTIKFYERLNIKMTIYLHVLLLLMHSVFESLYNKL